MKKFLFLIFFCNAFVLFSQKVVITDVKKQQSKVYIHYNLYDTNPNSLYTIKLQVNDNGNTFYAEHLAGDKEVTPGKNKILIWDYSSDNILLYNSVDFQIVATRKTIVRKNYVVKSLIFPGLGTYEYRGKPKLLRGFFVYGAYGISLGSYFIGKSNYNKYLEAKDFEQRMSYLKKSKFWGYTALGFSVYATGLWAWDIFQAALVNQSNTAFFRRFRFYPSYDFCYNTAGLTVKLKF